MSGNKLGKPKSDMTDSETMTVKLQRLCPYCGDYWWLTVGEGPVSAGSVHCSLPEQTRDTPCPTCQTKRAYAALPWWRRLATRKPKG